MSAVDTIYDELHNQSKFSAEASWCLLTMQILDKVVEELFEPKEDVMTSVILIHSVLTSCTRAFKLTT